MSTTWDSKADAVLLLHEIYGKNAHVHATGDRLAAAGYAVHSPDWFGGAVYGYDQTDAAYAHFKLVGFTAASRQVNTLACKLRRRHRRVFVVGYSVGATVAWLCAASGLYAGAIGYYGSRIRDFSQLVPSCPTLLLFAAQDSFDVRELYDRLAAHTIVRQIMYQAGHGFADRFSPHYDVPAAAEADQAVLDFLRETAALPANR